MAARRLSPFLFPEYLDCGNPWRDFFYIVHTHLLGHTNFFSCFTEFFSALGPSGVEKINKICFHKKGHFKFLSPTHRGRGVKFLCIILIIGTFKIT